MIKSEDVPIVADGNSSSTILRRGNIKTPVFFMEEPEHKEFSDEEKELLKKFKDAKKLYKEVSANGSTFNLQITKEAFDRLQGREGMVTETGQSRLLEILEEPSQGKPGQARASQGKPGQARATYHLIVSPYTNVQRISESDYTDEKALTLSALGLTPMSWKVKFGLAQISKNTVSDIEDRSSIYPEDLIKIETINLEDANELIGYSKPEQNQTLLNLDKENQDEDLDGVESEVEKINIFNKLEQSVFNLLKSKEGFFFMWNYTMMSIELNRNFAHDLNNTPPRTEGIIGFFDQHMGDVFETLALFYVARIPVELISRVIEATSDKEISPRVKMGVSMLFSMIVISYLELSGVAGGNIDKLDIFGVLLAGVYAAVGNEVIDYLFSEEKESHTFSKWIGKIKEIAKLTERIDVKKIANKIEVLSELMSHKGEKLYEATQKKLLEHFQMVDDSMDYIDMEQRVLILMMENRQLNRMQKIKDLFNGASAE